MMLSAFVLNVWGCATTQPTRFYMLRAISDSSNQDQSEKGSSGISLGVGPIKFPKYLNRPQLVTRANRYELDLNEFHKWAEPLETNFSHVLAQNLSVLLSTERIELFPWNRPTKIDYQLVVVVLEFDGTNGGDTVLLVHWKLLSGDGSTLLAGKKSRFTQKPNDQDPKYMVAALSQTLADLSQEIATGVKTLTRRGGGE